jgi:transposase
VERFIRYVQGSFWVPFTASMKQAGVVPGHHAANAAVSRWLRDVANAHVHGTTGEMPAARLLVERQDL